MQTSTIRPGLLVSLKTSMRGNVKYEKRDIELDHMINESTRKASWETERTIADSAEFEAASKVRSAATYAVSKVCASTAFGYLCPEDSAADLEQAIKEARVLIDNFNAKARITRLALYIITGRVAPDDVEAVKAIRAELRDLTVEMERGIDALNPERVREAAKRAKQLSTMLVESSRQKVDDAVDAARKCATSINKAIKAGEQASVQIDGMALQALASARTMFLDLDEQPIEVAAASVTPRALDLEAASV